VAAAPEPQIEAGARDLFVDQLEMVVDVPRGPISLIEPAWLETLTMRPCFPARSSGRSANVIRHAPSVFVCHARSTRSRSASAARWSVS
jgi:hypothetical protein